MKVLIEVVIISLLIIIGWRQPFQEHAARILPAETAAQLGIRKEAPAKAPGSEVKSPAVPAPPAAPSSPAPHRDELWMWKPKPLDPPRY